jgi:hypothetical protein
MSRRSIDKESYYRGIAMRPYDLLKEVTVALLGSLVVVLVLAAVFSSPDVPSATIQSWSQADPVDFVTTAANELAGGTTVANYGAPYNSGTASVQSWGFLHPQEWAGTHININPPNDFVLQPLAQSTAGDKDLGTALIAFNNASADQQAKWLTPYVTALADAKVTNDVVTVVAGDYGPVPTLMDRMLKLARSGGLDALLLTSDHFYQSDFTKPLLFLNDGGYLAGMAKDQHLLGNQWGLMNETGRYPGQAWLWLYTMWYQIPPYTSTTGGALGISAANADLTIVATIALLSLLLVLVPFIPGVRDIPRWIPIHRLIWRRYYRDIAGSRSAPRPPPVDPHSPAQVRGADDPMVTSVSGVGRGDSQPPVIS